MDLARSCMISVEVHLRKQTICIEQAGGGGGGEKIPKFLLIAGSKTF